jgi:Leucine-rich repeat (LRR) protein
MNALQAISECIHHKYTVLELRKCNLRNSDLAWALLAACSQLTELRLREIPKLTSLKILEQLPNLEILHLNLDKVADLSILQKLPKLKDLYLSGFNCNILATLQALPELEVLHLSPVFDENVPYNFSFLERLINLKDLRIAYCSIKDIDFLPPLKKLEKLILNCNMLEDISPISQFENLTYLDISHNYIPDFSPLQACRKLAFISAFDNKFTSLPDMSNLNQLNFLDVSESRISDLSPLMALPLLDCLYTYDNPIKVRPPALIIHFLGQVQDKNPPIKEFLRQREPPQIELIWQFLATGQSENILLAEQLAIATDWTKEEIRVYTKFADRHLREG